MSTEPVVRIFDIDGSVVTGDSLLDALNEAHVFGVKRLDDGRFRFRESCDDYFSATLTKEQVRALAEELRALAEGGST